jgi:magnesium transporter
MIQTCYQLKKDAYLSSIPCDSLAAQPAEGKGDCWLEIEAATPDELAPIIKPYALHPLMVEDILNPEHSTLLDRYPEAVYIEFPTNLENSGDAIAYLSIIMLPHLIATIHRGQIPGMQTLLERLQHEVRLPFARTIAVLYYILDHFIDKNALAALKLRDRVGELEKAFGDDPDEISLSMLTQLKQQIRALTNMAEDQHYCVMSLIDIHSPALDFSGYESYIHDLASNAEHVLRALGRSEERVSDLERSFQLMVHDASEKRLRILTIISAVFLPLTVLTGFFGMNFKGMILLDWHYGFWLALAFMIITLLGMSWYFYRKGWFE